MTDIRLSWTTFQIGVGVSLNTQRRICWFCLGPLSVTRWWDAA